MPLPVIRIAPKPIRRTTRSPPISMVPAPAAPARLVMSRLPNVCPFQSRSLGRRYPGCDSRTVTNARKLPGHEHRRAGLLRLPGELLVLERRLGLLCTSSESGASSSQNDALSGSRPAVSPSSPHITDLRPRS
jgi:hypothetical protein